MKEWKEYNIGEICDTISDTYKGNASNVVLINTSDVLEGKCLNHTFVPNKDLRGQFKKQLKKNDILYSEIRPANKRYAFIDFEPTDYIASTKLMVIRSNDKVLPKFLYYILQSKEMIENLQFLAESRSGTFPQITFSELAIQTILLPEVKEQNIIVNFLEALDSKIELNRRINDNLEQQAQALFKAWFVDFEPWQGVMPDDWREGSIYEIVDVIYGAPYKSNLFNEKKEGLPLIRIRDLKDYSPQYYTPEILPNTEFVCMGDVIAGMDAEFIPTLWMGNKGVLNQRCCKFKSKNPKFSNYYIMYLLKPELEFVQSYKTGTTVSHLGKSDIDRFIVVIPSSDVIEDFSRKVEPLLSEKIKICKEMRILSSLRDTLLPKLMSGELKINDLNR